MNAVSIGSDNGLSPVRRQAIIWTSVGLLSNGNLRTNFNEILIKMQNLSFTKMHLKISSAKWRPFCPGGNELMSFYTELSAAQLTSYIVSQSDRKKHRIEKTEQNKPKGRRKKRFRTEIGRVMAAPNFDFVTFDLEKFCKYICEYPAYNVFMMTSSNGSIFRVTGNLCGGIHRSPVNSPHKGQWREALMFSLICVWINGWVNNSEAGDLRRYRAHNDVTVIST